MVPLSTLASRLHRTVNTGAARRGKLVNLVLEGEETRLDKAVIEEIADPLLHILRNAIDHGIEAPSIREAKGKPAQGTIRLQAFHDNTQTVIQIRDDGGGLKPERIRQAALKHGLLSAADAANLSTEELFSLIFLPGFSTADEVSEISGRGVGMDVVKSAVHRLKGSISLESQPDDGTVFTLRLPMTLAVMRALMVKTQQQIFAIPLSGMAQVVKLTPQLLDHIGQDVVVRTNDKVYPLLQLSKLIKLKRQEATPTSQMALLMNIEDRQFAIAVDETLGGREIVVKNLGNHLRRVPGVIGATLLGDGNAVLILNLPELLRDIFRPRVVMFEKRAETKPPASAQLQAPKVIVPPAVSAPPVNSLPTAKPAAGPLTIMVVDDSLSVRRVLSNRLNSAGWNPLLAKDGLDALEQLQQMTIPPDLLLVDIEMPRMDGYEFINTLRKQTEYAHLPVIVLTSRAGQKHRDRAFEVGATEYLVKPYQDDVLLSLIRRLANHRSYDKQ
jgi:chemosensory pili system protein ChpA (sensor histidine kinase/response regulator)